jgi:ABC-type polysaccharide/polyol phosphate export permease
MPSSSLIDPARADNASAGAQSKHQARSPHRTRGRIVYLLDDFLAFIALERALILRNVRSTTGDSSATLFNSALRAALVIIAHAYFFWAIQRSLPGGMSYIEFVASAFAPYFVFAAALRQALPSTMRDQSNVSQNIKWIHSFVAAIIWEASMIIVSILTVTILFDLLQDRRVGSFSGFSDFPLFILSFCLAALFGVGLGLVLQLLERRWYSIHLLRQILGWIIFVTSGIYEGVTPLPPNVEAWLELNPLLSVVRYSRHATKQAVLVGDVTLAYPAAAGAGLLIVGLILLRRRGTSAYGRKRVEFPTGAR